MPEESLTYALFSSQVVCVLLREVKAVFRCAGVAAEGVGSVGGGKLARKLRRSYSRFIFRIFDGLSFVCGVVLAVVCRFSFFLIFQQDGFAGILSGKRL